MNENAPEYKKYSLENFVPKSTMYLHIVYLVSIQKYFYRKSCLCCPKMKLTARARQWIQNWASMIRKPYSSSFVPSTHGEKTEVHSTMAVINLSWLIWRWGRNSWGEDWWYWEVWCCSGEEQAWPRGEPSAWPLGGGGAPAPAHGQKVLHVCTMRIISWTIDQCHLTSSVKSTFLWKFQKYILANAIKNSQCGLFRNSMSSMV